jgi:hypothetical protein
MKLACRHSIPVRCLTLLLLLVAGLDLMLWPQVWLQGQGPLDGQGDDPLPHKVYLPIIFGPILGNASFEEPGFEPSWQWTTPDVVTYQVRTDTQIALHGERFLAANRLNDDFGNKSFYQDTRSPEAGSTYTFSIWVRAKDSSASPRTGRVALWAFGGVPEREHSTRNFQVSGTAWQCVETSLTVQAGGHAILRAEVYLTSLDSIDTYFDNARLTNIGPSHCPPSNVINGPVVSNGQGFDTCAAPSLNALSAWRQASPYDYFGIYLGGANHYQPCRTYNQQYQTAAWLNSVRQQGWQLIPTWVGPQAPCTSYGTVMSNDPTTARGQGIAEARQALAVAANLELSTPTVIYYDMERYDTGNNACHSAVNAFLAGWVSELQNSGHQAGIYGATNAVNDWYTLVARAGQYVGGALHWYRVCADDDCGSS